MSHFAENCRPLDLATVSINSLTQLSSLEMNGAEVVFFWLPWGRTAGDAKRSAASFETIAAFLQKLSDASTVAILTTPPDAAIMLSSLTQALSFKLWVAVKTVPEAAVTTLGSLPVRHASLIVLTRYKTALRHVPIRIRYSHCPSCGKTTKDYGGKKHMYHTVGTLMSDVWTDVECNPQDEISEVTRRLQDLFGLMPYRELLLVDLRKSEELAPTGAVHSDKSLSMPINGARSTPPARERIIRSRLINKDCVEALKRLPSESVDFCFADLPYNLKKKYYRYKDARGPEDYFQWCNEWLSELHRVLKPGRTLAVLNVPQWSAKHFGFLSSLMDFQSWIVWDALGFPSRKIMPAHYAILCFSKGEARRLPGVAQPDENLPERSYLSHRKQFYCIRPSCVSKRRSVNETDHVSLYDIWSDIHRLTHNSRRVNHPCQLPPLLMRRLFALFTVQGEMILDCFNGAGTSTLVAHQMSRRFLGIERSKRYHTLAAKRHRLLDSGGDPFGRNDKIPIAKNSPVVRLPKQEYEVSKKVLQLDVKRIAVELGRMPKRDDVQTYSQYPMRYFDRYFTSWGEVCAAARVSGQGSV